MSSDEVVRWAGMRVSAAFRERGELAHPALQSPLVLGEQLSETQKGRPIFFRVVFS